MSKQKKYEFTGETNYLSRYVKLRQIRALIDIPHCGVKAGDVGGWIQKVRNLPHDNLAWVTEDATVYGDAKILQKSVIKGHAVISGNAEIKGTSIVSGFAQISGNSLIHDSAIFDNVQVSGWTNIFSSQIRDKVILSGDKVKPGEIIHSTISSEVNFSNSFKVENTTMEAEHCYISGDVSILYSTIEGSKIEIKENVQILDAYVQSKPSPEGHPDEGLHLSGNALIQDAKIYSEGNVFISEDAQVTERAIIAGKDILIEGMATISGRVQVSSKSHMKDCSSICASANRLHSYVIVENMSMKDDDVYPSLLVNDIQNS